LIAEGTYQDCEVLAAKIDDSGYQNALVLALETAVTANGETHAVLCRHALEGEWAHITEAVFKLLGLAWPDGVRDVSPVVGQRVPVKVKHKTDKRGNVHANGYVAVATGGKPATPQALESFIARTKPSDAISEFEDAPPF